MDGERADDARAHGALVARCVRAHAIDAAFKGARADALSFDAGGGATSVRRRLPFGAIRGVALARGSGANSALRTLVPVPIPNYPSRPIRVLIAKPGLDGHDRGAKVVAAALRDAGMEVIYTGLHQTPEMISTAAVQEDVDVIGLSILSGAHMTLFPRIRALLVEAGREDILITGGGIIPKEDMASLSALGIGELFGPGTPTTALIEYIRAWFQAKEAQSA